jgi:hypothetical protein
MTFDDYQHAWRATGTMTPLAREVDIFIQSMSRSERKSRILRGVCAVNAIIAVLLTIFIVLFRRPLAWNELAPALGLQTVVTFALIIVIRRGQARRRALASAGLTVREAAQTGLAHIAGELRDFRFLLKLLFVIVPLLGASVVQLISSGKMDIQEALSFALIVAIILSLNVIVQWWRYRRILAPRRKRLQQILISFEEESC